MRIQNIKGRGLGAKRQKHNKSRKRSLNLIFCSCSTSEIYYYYRWPLGGGVSLHDSNLGMYIFIRPLAFKFQSVGSSLSSTESCSVGVPSTIVIEIQKNWLIRVKKCMIQLGNSPKKVEVRKGWVLELKSTWKHVIKNIQHA